MRPVSVGYLFFQNYIWHKFGKNNFEKTSMQHKCRKTQKKNPPLGKRLSQMMLSADTKFQDPMV